MKGGLRQSMAWLHTWSGLLVGWVLFAVFLTGTLSYVRPEITQWMRPELHGTTANPDAATVAMRRMQEQAPGATLWSIGLPDDRQPIVTAFWRSPTIGGRGFRTATFDSHTGRDLASRETLGGAFFYRFHYQLHYMAPVAGRWIVGFCTMFMLVAIVSGIITHRRIFADFFTFRPGKGQRSWLDAHNATAVLALPFHLVITYTGLVTLMLLYMPWGIEARYGADRAAFNAEVFAVTPPGQATGRPAPLVADIRPLIAEAERHWGEGRVGRIVVNHPGDAAATIQLLRDDEGRLSTSRRVVQFDGVTGAFQSATPGTPPAAETRGIMVGLHLGGFGGWPIRALLLLSGIAGTIMVGSGLLLWAVKEHKKAGRAGRPGFGVRLVDRLNLAVVGGMPVAVAAFLWLNRLLPVGMADRPQWEANGFFIVWGVLAAAAMVRPGRQAWALMLALAAGLFLLLPVLNALTTSTHLGVSLARGYWGVAGVDLGGVVVGLALALAAARLARAPGRPVRALAAAEQGAGVGSSAG
ncbi:membrane protein [Allostella vacuolata]|nr:membrane protein [Stella vacuolata]